MGGTVLERNEGTDGFEAWYLAMHARLIASLLLLAGNRADAEDAVDEACSRALARWDRVGAMESPSGWTYRVALNALRRQRRRVSLERVLLAGHARQARPEDMPAPAGEIWEVVRQLPVRQRTAIVLRFVADLTEAEIGRTMGVSRTTAASALADGRRNLADGRRNLSKLLEDHPSMTGAL